MPDPTFGSAAPRSFLPAILIAAAVLAVAGVAIFYFNPHRTAELTVTGTKVFAPVTEFKHMSGGGGAHVIGVPSNKEQDLFVAVTIHLQNELRGPIFLDEADADFTGADGAGLQTSSPLRADLNRTEDIFPQLKPLLPHPLLLGDEVPAKTAADGQILLHFPILDEHAWQARKSATLTLHFLHQEPITVEIH